MQTTTNYKALVLEGSGRAFCAGGDVRYSAAKNLSPPPGFLSRGYSLFPCGFQLSFFSTWGDPEVGGGDNFWGS